MECTSDSKASGDSPKVEALGCVEKLDLLNAPGAATELTERQTRSIEYQKAARGLWERVPEDHRLRNVLFKECNLEEESLHL
jgi:hypothetical protein